LSIATKVRDEELAPPAPGAEELEDEEDEDEDERLSSLLVVPPERCRPLFEELEDEEDEDEELALPTPEAEELEGEEDDTGGVAIVPTTRFCHLARGSLRRRSLLPRKASRKSILPSSSALAGSPTHPTSARTAARSPWSRWSRVRCFRLNPDLLLDASLISCMVGMLLVSKSCKMSATVPRRSVCTSAIPMMVVASSIFLIRPSISWIAAEELEDEEDEELGFVRLSSFLISSFTFCALEWVTGRASDSGTGMRFDFSIRSAKLMVIGTSCENLKMTVL
jgi:hypothetical protein